MSTAAYYNEIDPYAAQWLRNLIAAGHIAPGDVDERSIEDVKPDDIKHYTQCHFFAGLGGWSYALRLAGWPDDKPIWTGSCPCQPFSAAGKGDGFDDPRHLWPDFAWLIRECKPPVIAGEQVASKAVDAWIDLVQADLEAMGYAFASIPFPSAGVGAPHIRDRNNWVADRYHHRQQPGAWNGRSGQCSTAGNHSGRCSEIGPLGDASLMQTGTYNGQHRSSREQQGPTGGHGISSSLANTKPAGFGTLTTECLQQTERTRPSSNNAGSRSGTDGLANGYVDIAGAVNGFWSDADWLYCRDGKWRPVEPGTFPLAHGVSNRVGRLCAYGNAINAEASAEFIRAYMEAR